MSDFFGSGVAISLGDMQLTGFAVPERVSHGVKQQLTIHRLPGGGRVIDAMGLDEPPITWSGILLGAGAQAQRQALFTLAANGQQVPCSWGDQYHVVIVESVDCDSQDGSGFADFGPARIGYRITCQILPPQPQDNNEDPSDYGTGETPSTPSDASDAGQGSATKARSAASSIPKHALGGSTRPVGDFDPQSTSFA